MQDIFIMEGMMRMYALVIAVVTFLHANIAAAQETPLTCEQLGYTRSVSDCGDRKMLFCPYDQDKAFCPCSKCYDCVCFQTNFACNDAYNGAQSTDMLIKESEGDALVAGATRDYYPEGLKYSAVFGQGNWYLPSIGELAMIKGMNVANLTEIEDYSTAASDGYWSSTIAENKDSSNTQTKVYMYKDSQIYKTRIDSQSSAWSKNYTYAILRLTGCFTANSCKPNIGDIMMDNRTWISKKDYEDGKYANRIPAGKIVWISDDGEIIIESLSFLKSTDNGEGEFDPEESTDCYLCGNMRYTLSGSSSHEYSNVIEPDDLITQLKSEACQ